MIIGADMTPHLVSLIFRKGAIGVSNWISRKGSVGVSNWISRRGGCFRCPISTLSAVSDESLRYPSSLPSKISPWLMLPPAAEAGDVVHNFYSLAENRVLSLNNNKAAGGVGGGKLGFPDDDTKLVGSSHGWLALLDKRDNDLFLTNPLSRRRVNLPPIQKLPIDEKNLSSGVGWVSKVILSCSPEEEEENCRAMMIFGPGYALAFCCPGRSTEWTPIGARFAGRYDVRCYQSCVYSAAQKLFYCVTRGCEFEAWDLQDPHSPRMIPMTDLSVDPKNFLIFCHSDEEGQLKYMCRNVISLVVNEKSGELFVVKRFVAENVDPDGSFVPHDSCYISPEEGWDDSHPYKTIGFDVHKYDAETRALRYMDCSLDGLAFFIGTNHNFAITAGEFPELKPDSIYYTDVLTSYDTEEFDYGGHDIGIFSYKDRTFSPCYYPCDANRIKRISPPPIWYTPSRV